MKSSENKVTPYACNYEVLAMRTEINILDDKIVDLLKQRLSLVHQVREVKHIEGLPFHNSAREDIILGRATSDADEYEQEYLAAIYKSLLEVTRTVADKKFDRTNN